MILERVQFEDDTWHLISPDGEYQLRTHEVNDDCIDHGCAIHNPDQDAQYVAENWPLNWRTDRGILEYICPCGIGHPVPEGIRWLERTHGPRTAWAESVHGCCLNHCDTTRLPDSAKEAA